MPKYLLRTVLGDPKTLCSFRFSEIDSLCKIFGVDVPCYNPDEIDLSSPFIYVNLPSQEIAFKIIHRSVLIRGVYECWGQGKTFAECQQCVLDHSLPTLNEVMTDDKTFSVRVEGFGISYTDKEQEAIRKHFKDIPFNGPVELKKPINQLIIFSDVGHHTYKSKADVPKEKPAPRRVFFAREIYRDKRQEYNKYTLKKRLYLGPTSTSADLAFLMANQGLCKKNDVCFDPFVGTGSLLVAAAHFGCVSIGSDLDWKVIHGQMRGKTHNIYDNFKQYKLPRPELICSDQSMDLWRSQTPPFEAMKFDCIICDPPYGVRAGAKKSGSTRKEVRDIPDEYKDCHVPQSQPYSVADVMLDLLSFAARTLRVGGRLVYLLPTHGEFTDADIPQHPALKLVSCDCQLLRNEFCRRLVTMEKVRDCSQEEAALIAGGVEGGDTAFNDIRGKLAVAFRERVKAQEEKRALKERTRKAEKEAARAEAKAKAAAAAATQSESTDSADEASSKRAKVVA